MERTVLVTGAGSGIGLASAIEAARLGFRAVAAVHEPAQIAGVHAAAAEAGATPSVEATVRLHEPSGRGVEAKRRHSAAACDELSILHERLPNAAGPSRPRDRVVVEVGGVVDDPDAVAHRHPGALAAAGVGGDEGAVGRGPVDGGDRDVGGGPQALEQRT